MTDDEFLMETGRRFATRVKAYEKSHALRITVDMVIELGDGREVNIQIKEVENE